MPSIVVFTGYTTTFLVKEEKYWVLLAKKLAGEATAAELDELREMLSANPEWAANLENLSEFWASAPVQSRAAEQRAEDAYLAHINRLKGRVADFEAPAAGYGLPYEAPRKPLYKKWGVYALAAAALVAVALLVPFGERPAANGGPASKPANEISISKGSRTKIVLPDGSSVWVNAGSKLAYGTFDANGREVHLDGEAYFDVAKDPARPFTVHTAGIDIKVLGTAFNVKAYTVDPTIEATLIHGSIEVTDKTQPGAPKIMLKPRQKLVFTKALAAGGKQPAQTAYRPDTEATSPITIKPLAKKMSDTAIVETAWIYNKLVFEDERFADLAVRLERWYNIKITIENERLKQLRISGSFVNETAEEAVKVLQLLAPFNYTINKNEIKIMGK
jgi:transmembrane sensor